MGVGLKLPPFINLKCGQIGRYKSVGIGDGIVNPIYGCGVKMAPYINPIYAGLERSCPRDSKNVSYIGKGLVQTLF